MEQDEIDEKETDEESLDEIVKECKAAYKEADEASADMREQWLSDMKFARLGEQWEDKDVERRKAEGRPCLTINRMPAFIRQVTNDARQNKPSIKCHPLDDDASEETAEILDGLIRGIEYNSNADVAYDTALDHAVTSGFGYWRIATDYATDDTFDQDIVIERIVNPLNVMGDPASTAADSSDWNVAFISEMMTEDEFEDRYPNAKKTTFDGKDTDELWFADDKIRICEYWKREKVAKKLLKLSDGTVIRAEMLEELQPLLDLQQIKVVQERETTGYKVTQYILNGCEVLETNNWAGKYIPIVPVYGDELNVEGKRHFISMIHSSIDSQRMFNYWRTASTELVALAPKAPFIGKTGAFDTDGEKWATANSVSHAYIEYDGDTPPSRQGFAGPPAGAIQEALNAADDMKAIMGLHDASMGARSNETSGRAILARQREGDVSTFNFVDNLSRAIRHTGKIIIDLIPSVYTAARIVRIVHEDGTNENVPINKPFPAKQPTGPVPKENEQQEFMAGVMKVYDVTAGKYDITVSTGPSYTSKREESAAQMMEFIRVLPAAAPLIGDLLAKNMDWPGADEISDRLQAMLPPQIAGQNPQVQGMQQQMQQMDQAAKQAIGQLQQQLAQATSEQQAKQIELQIKAKELQQKDAELANKQYEAETKRLDVQAKSQAEQERLRIDAYTAMTAQPLQQSVNPAPVDATPREQQPINITIDGSTAKAQDKQSHATA